ncbi:hypothetical protein D3C84_1123620 [compost metagenome]
MLVDEDQVVRTMVALKGFASLLDGDFGDAVGILDAQVHPQVGRRGLHELRITHPKSFRGGSRVQEQH